MYDRDKKLPMWLAGILLALWPLGQTVYANWNQQQLRARWQSERESEKPKPSVKSNTPAKKAATEIRSSRLPVASRWTKF